MNPDELTRSRLLRKFFSVRVLLARANHTIAVKEGRKTSSATVMMLWLRCVWTAWKYGALWTRNDEIRSYVVHPGAISTVSVKVLAGGDTMQSDRVDDAT